jgi:hypothetical protein
MEAVNDNTMNTENWCLKVHACGWALKYYQVHIVCVDEEKRHYAVMVKMQRGIGSRYLSVDMDYFRTGFPVVDQDFACRIVTTCLGIAKTSPISDVPRIVTVSTGTRVSTYSTAAIASVALATTAYSTLSIDVGETVVRFGIRNKLGLASAVTVATVLGTLGTVATMNFFSKYEYLYFRLTDGICIGVTEKQARDNYTKESTDPIFQNCWKL